MKNDRDDHAENVRAHYEHWPFPGCDFKSKESLLVLRTLADLLGARETKGTRPRILDAGCGTGNTLMALAKQFPQTDFLGVDISGRSIEMAREEAEARKLANASFQQFDIREDLSDLGQFAVVLCFGVLHHMEDMEGVLGQIVNRIERDGHLLLWLYGRHGRLKHTLNQDFIRLLCGDAPMTERFSVAREFVEQLGAEFAANSGFFTPKGSGEEGVSWMLEHPGWLADQMIPSCEQNLTMHEILDLFAGCGLDFVKWLGVPAHLGSYTSSRILLARFEALSGRERLLAIDCLVKPDYYLVAGKKR